MPVKITTFAQITNYIGMDILGKALLDYQKGHYTEDIMTTSSLDQDDVIQLPYLFRDYKAMPTIEQKALMLCHGDILDIGCGSGSHSLYLQNRGFEVTALDASEGAIATCSLRGIENCIHTDIMHFKETQFDTLLLLMNGIGLAGTLHNLGVFLSHLKKLLKPKGQILFDSSDIIYLFEDDIKNNNWVHENPEYYGEVQFTMSYLGEKSNSFPWLYLDQSTLHRVVRAHQFSCEIVSLGEHFDYLARLTHRE